MDTYLHLSLDETSAIAFFARFHGYPGILRRWHLLRLLLRGIRRSQASDPARPPRLPILPSHLLALRDFTAAHFSRADALMLHAAFTAAFFGLLRPSEFTSPRVASFTFATLQLSHVTFDRSSNQFSLRLPASKTDPYGAGTSVILFPLPSPACPVSALLDFLAVRPPLPGPLFSFASGAFLTRSNVATVLRAAFPSTPLLLPHSFRIGGATSLSNAGVPDHVIQLLGRWVSDSFLRYIRVDPAVVHRCHVSLAARRAASDSSSDDEGDP